MLHGGTLVKELFGPKAWAMVGGASDNGSRGPGFDSHWELGFFLSLLSLSHLSISGASLISSLVEVQHYWFSTFLKKNEKLSIAA